MRSITVKVKVFGTRPHKATSRLYFRVQTLELRVLSSDKPVQHLNILKRGKRNNPRVYVEIKSVRL